ncbi:tail fiber domain-containing protein [Providencia rettgeri]|uniref:tail fiber/spike domain-containing protein n=1 Tax=Providencia rettgeri TaxID=587 RepID=UPI0023AB2EDA|nr:tail fiber domain-containing protein [Providencia rettgeri]
MREVKPTQKPVPSSDIKDLFFNSGLLDIWATSLEHKYIDRFGNCHLTAAGMEWIFNELVEKFKVDMNIAIVAAGYITVDSFQQGADLPNNELTLRNHILRDEITGEYYRWDGDLPKQVPAGSTPESTGGIGKGAWVSVGDASLRGDLRKSDGSSIIGFKHPLYSSVHRTLQSKNEDLLSIQDLGAISGIANPNVDDKVIRIFNDNAGVLIPAGFVYVTAKSIATKAGAKFNIVCPNGKATIMSSGNYTMFTQPGQYKFQDCLFEGIRFVGNGIANASSVFMSAAADEWVAKFTTHNCSWSGFHSIWNASWIAVYHYNPIFHAVSDAGYIVNTPIFPTGFSSFNLNKIESPIFLEFRARNLFNIVGGYNLTIINPWFEKVEVFGDYLFDLKQFFGFKVIDGWFEYFKCKWFVRLNTDGTENTQSDFISFDGLHINNSRADSGFSGMVFETYPQYSDSFTDPKVSFKNITEHNNSRAGWCLLRASDATHDEINRYESFSELANLRLKFGQPPCSNGMTLTRNADNTKNADIKFSIRNLSTNNVMLTPSNYQAITGRTKSGQYQQSLIFDNASALKSGYFVMDDTAMLVWSRDFVRPGRNNVQTCGSSAYVWSGGFTQTAFQVTSDKREKESITRVTDVILDAWSKVNYVMYKLKDSVASKGEEARVHVGVIAQDIKEAFESSGLNPFELGILCYDKDVDKYSVRYEEMLCLEAAYMRRELSRIKSRN